MVEKNRYWFCIIGPTDQHKLPDGADLPMRMAVQEEFENLTGHGANSCPSGWGITEAEKKAMHDALHAVKGANL